MTAGYCVIGFDGPAHGLSEGKQTSIHEFEEVLTEMIRVKGQPEAIIAHSFGGVATLFSVMRGLPVRTVINIASPTIGDEVIRTYLRAINGSWSTGEFFKSYILKTEGRSFDEFSSLYFVKHFPGPIQLLLIHDDNDSEVEIRHAEAMMEVYPDAKLMRTQKLGHTRILKDDEVIRRTVTFIQENASDRQ
jgi:predicted alpha/beta hydrolase family esterase